MRVVTKWSTLLINTKKCRDFLRDEIKNKIREITTDLKNHQKHQVKFNFCAFLDLGQVGIILQSLFRTFRNRKFPPMSHTSGFGVKKKTRLAFKIA